MHVSLEAGEAVAGDGDFDPSIVARTLRTRLSAIRACYRQRLRESPTLSGRVTVGFVISPSGAVSEVNVPANTTGDANLARCMTQVVRRLRFNPGAENGSVRFEYPFWFAPGE